MRHDCLQLNCSWESCVSPFIWPERIENPTWALGDAALQCCWLRALLPPQLQSINLVRSQNLLFYLVALSSRQQDPILQMNLVNYDLINTFVGKFITDTVTAAAGSLLSLVNPFTLTMWYNMLQVHKMFLFQNSLGCTNYQTLLAMISLLSFGNPDPFWGCIGKLTKQVEGEHTTFYVLFWLAAKWMLDGFSGYMTSWIWFTSSYIYKWTSELSTFESSTTVVHLWICEGKSNPLSQFLNKQVHACIHLV